jgi:hypothetical protein
MIDLKGGPTGTEIYKQKYNDLLQLINEIPLAIRQQIVDALSQERMDEFRQDTTAWRILTQGLSEVSGSQKDARTANETEEEEHGCFILSFLEQRTPS